ncbi:hypothetical protein FC19_GL001108 [Liquorilactobacillus aquaticus DSM 21051]|uniref:HTH tetR-type domain-containing protein n=1 Tax=Liquorilactobacillus aquaticus DSM 21051 TaxID=1423725 RepID=A0A0R2D623_9LACO|nr:TetR/AcrR family transcriptional regulator [Liquorilactobacillus aquaticus]KRM96041.1 hypothetical protein FC19_GL001108 [Liquorilactobacillus aquaticus DSM 21051]
MEYVRQRKLTQQKIKKGFIFLMQNNKFETITVNDISKKAEISRSSFYRYYFDKYELMNEIEDDILEAIKDFQKKQLNQDTANFDISNSNYIEELLLFMEKYSAEINGLLNNNSNTSFENKLRAKLTNKLYTIARKSVSTIKMNVKKKQVFQLVVEYMTGMIIQTFKFWSSPDCKMSVKELSDLLNNIKLNGFSKITMLLK